jgi:hypothetical protein
MKQQLKNQQTKQTQRQKLKTKKNTQKQIKQMKLELKLLQRDFLFPGRGERIHTIGTGIENSD